MAAQRDIDRLIDKYRLHRQARAGEPLVVDEQTRERLMSVVEDQYGTAGFVSAQEAAEKYAQSRARKEGIEQWWRRMVPWVGFAGVCCLALIVVFVAANQGTDSRQTLVQGPDLMQEVEAQPIPSAAPSAAPAAAPPANNSGSADKSEVAAGVAPVAPTKSAPPPMPQPKASRAIVIQAPSPDPSAPMAEEPGDERKSVASVVTTPRLAAANRGASMDADTTPASALVPVGARSAPAKRVGAPKPEPRRTSRTAGASLSPIADSAAQMISSEAFDPVPSSADSTTDSTGRSAAQSKTAPARARASVPLPPPTPIVWETPQRAAPSRPTSGAAGSPAELSAPPSAPASTPRMQKFRSTGPVLYRRKLNSATGNVILGQFDLLTSGSRVTIKDADGSIYSGRVSAAEGERFSFRVAGRNRTSRQNVEFTGTYSPAASSPDGSLQRPAPASLRGDIKVGGGSAGQLSARRIR